MDGCQTGESDLGSDFICDGSVDESVSDAAMEWISEEADIERKEEEAAIKEVEEYVPGILESMGCLDSDSEDERENQQGQVKCLYTVAELEKACQKQQLRLSAEANRYLLHLTVRKLGQSRVQKIVKKLVEAGHLEWEEEGYEVESILDYAKEEDGTEYYLIKWKYWSNAFNTWEPITNLGCPDLVQKFHRINKIGDTPPVGKLLSVTMQDDDESTKASIDNLYQRILESTEPMTPLKLLELHSPPKNEHMLIRRKTKGASEAIAKRRKLRAKMNLSNKRTVAYRKIKTEATVALKEWERSMNELKTGAPLVVENEVDLDGPPEKFQYIKDYLEGPNVSIPTDPVVGCECSDCYEERKTCCGVMAGHDYAYYKGGKVRLPRGVPIYECNKRCGCGPECPNRVVQHGRRHKVAIFKTRKAGWGVKALQKIKKGSFVMEYVGEVITHEEAERRGRIYDAECRTYLFDLDFNGDDSPFIVDAGFYGNESHFVNHSCDPNMAVYAVWINTLDPRLPRLALFAKRDICKDEELTFDYMMTGDTTAQAEGEEGLEGSAVTPRKMQRPGFRLQEEDMKMDMSLEDAEDDAEPLVDNIQEEPKPLDTDLFSKPLSQDDLKALRVDTMSSKDVASVPTPPPSESGTADSSFDEPFKIPASKMVSPSPAMKYRIMCQCGAKNCRKYLF